MEKVGLELKQIQKQGVINGFSYLFCKGLLEKLKSLREEDRIFKETPVLHNDNCHISDIAFMVIRGLNEQIFNTSAWSCDMLSPLLVNEIISTTEEFLAIFE